jgi:hypothetical protein
VGNQVRTPKASFHVNNIVIEQTIMYCVVRLVAIFVEFVGLGIAIIQKLLQSLPLQQATIMAIGIQQKF